MTDVPTIASPVAKDEIPARVLPFMDAARALVHGRALNPVEKTARKSDILRCPAFESGNYDYSPAGTDQRNKLWAEYYALTETESVSDLTPERRAKLLKAAHDLLSDAERYSFAYLLTKEVEEENLGLEEPSRTRNALQARADERTDDISDYLSHAIMGEDYAFAKSLYHTGRRRRRFRFHRKASWGELIITDICLKVPFVKLEFGRVVEWCETIRDIKRACGLWDVKCAAHHEGEAVVIGPGFEIHRER